LFRGIMDLWKSIGVVFVDMRGNEIEMFINK